MLTFYFLNVYLGHTESSAPVVTDSLIDNRGKWVPNRDDRKLMPRLDMMFDRVEVCLEFYKRYAVYVGFSYHNGPTGKSKAGKCWKRYVCSKEGFHRPAKMPKITTVTAEAMPQAPDSPEGRKLRQKLAETREGCQAHILMRSTDDAKFEIIKFHERHV